MNGRKSRMMIAATLLVTASGLALADNDRCKNVRFRVTNEHSTGKVIKITGVTYDDLVNNKTVTKDLAALECDIHATCVTSDKDLHDVEGNNIKNIHFVFRYKEHDGDWSDKVKSKGFDPEKKECRADRIYGAAPTGFVIGGS